MGKEMGHLRLLLIVVLAVLVLMPAAMAQVSQEQAELAIETAEASIQEMQDAGLPVTRVSDSLDEARQLFDAQKALEASVGSSDYGPVVERTDEIADTKDLAFNTNDDLGVLELTLQEIEGINKTAVQLILDRARQEFQDERYEQAGDLIEKAYGKISEEQAFSTKVAFFLATAQKNMVTFIASNWILLTGGSIITIIILVLFYGEMSKMRLKRRLTKLNLRKGIINNMIKRIQREYFELGKLSEETYKIKMRKFEELLRDINRQMPLVRRELSGRSSLIARLRTRL